MHYGDQLESIALLAIDSARLDYSFQEYIKNIFILIEWNKKAFDYYWINEHYYNNRIIVNVGFNSICMILKFINSYWIKSIKEVVKNE